MTQTLRLGSYARAVEAALDQLSNERIIQRVWDRDASVWSADPHIQAMIRNRLGWLQMPRTMAQQVDALRDVAREIHHSGITHALLLGMGGSGLFAEVCRQVLGVAQNSVDLAVLDTTDPTAIRSAHQHIPLKQLLVVVSSKSGSTAEISALSTYFDDALTSSGVAAGAQMIAITDVGTPLEQQAAAWKCRRVFSLGPTTGADVGGRFSALTFFGLVPAALIGADLARLLERAQTMAVSCALRTPIRDNPGAQLGATLGVLATQGRNKLTLLSPPSLERFGLWVEQLIAESTGKSGQGIVPVCGEPRRDPSMYQSDRVFVELQLAGEWDDALDRDMSALEAGGHPVIRIRWQDRNDLGGEVVKWSMATALAGYFLKVNPFDEPNVQESKDRTKILLTQYVKDGQFPAEAPLFTEGALSLYGPMPSSAPQSVSQGLAALFRQAHPTEYLALLSFVPRTPALDQAVHMIRTTIASGLGHATVLGFGPRYLHSTGQLFKGGPDTGVFLFLTAEESEDLAIPGEPLTFGVLKQAQALGDVQAMRQRGRRVLRVHLRGQLNRAAQQLISAIDQAIAVVARR